MWLTLLHKLSKNEKEILWLNGLFREGEHQPHPTEPPNLQTPDTLHDTPLVAPNLEMAKSLQPNNQASLPSLISSAHPNTPTQKNH